MCFNEEGEEINCTWQFQVAGIPGSDDNQAEFLFARHCQICGCTQKLEEGKHGTMEWTYFHRCKN